ncbi:MULTISPECIES: hypothetical protein [unclassified Pseudomonas]
MHHVELLGLHCLAHGRTVGHGAGPYAEAGQVIDQQLRVLQRLSSLGTF